MYLKKEYGESTVTAWAAGLTILFDLILIASIGIIFYLVMDIVIQWGVLKKLRGKIHANPAMLILTIAMDILVLSGFLWVKIVSDVLIVALAIGLMALIFFGEKWFISRLKMKGPEQ